MKILNKKPETFEIDNLITYNRINELEALLNDVQTKLIEIYPDEFKDQETLSDEVDKAIENLWEMRRDYDFKKLMEFKK